MIRLGNKSLEYLRAQNAADAAALAGVACLARGLNSMAMLTAAKVEKDTGESLIYPFNYTSYLTTPPTPVYISLQPISGLASEYEQKKLFFNPLPASPEVINEGESKARMAEQLDEKKVREIVIEHLKLIRGAIDKTQREYVDIDTEVREVSKRCALENGYEIKEVSPGGGDIAQWQPTWEDKDIVIEYNYWREYRSKTVNTSCKKPRCAQLCSPCGFTARACCGEDCDPRRYTCYCKRCWKRTQTSYSYSLPFWTQGSLHSTEVNVSISLANKEERRATGALTNICSGAHPPSTCGQLFPPQPHFEVHLKE